MKAEQVQSRLRAANSLLCAWARKQSAARKHPAALSVSAVRSSLTTSPWTCTREVRTRNSKSGGSKPKPACLKLTCSKPTARIPGSATSYGCCCKTALGRERLGERSEDGVPARRQTCVIAIPSESVHRKRPPAQPKIGGFGIKHTNFASIGGLNVEPANQAQQKLSTLSSVGFRTGQQKGFADPGNTLSFAFSD